MVDQVLYMNKKQALYSIEQNGELHYCKAPNGFTADDILEIANQNSPFIRLMELGETISGENYAAIQQSDRFTFSVELNFDSDAARIYEVNNGKGGVAEENRSYNNVRFTDVKISEHTREKIKTAQIMEKVFSVDGLIDFCDNGKRTQEMISAKGTDTRMRKYEEGFIYAMDLGARLARQLKNEIENIDNGDKITIDALIDVFSDRAKFGESDTSLFSAGHTIAMRSCLSYAQSLKAVLEYRSLINENIKLRSERISLKIEKAGLINQITAMQAHTENAAEDTADEDDDEEFEP